MTNFYPSRGFSKHHAADKKFAGVSTTTLVDAPENAINKPKKVEQFRISIDFKPFDTKLRLRSEERRLLLAHIDEILREVEIEEQKIISEENLRATASNLSNEMVTA